MFKFGSSNKDRIFYDAFEKHATCGVPAARLFLETLYYPERAIELSMQVVTIEGEGDPIAHDSELEYSLVT